MGEGALAASGLNTARARRPRCWRRRILRQILHELSPGTVERADGEVRAASIAWRRRWGADQRPPAPERPKAAAQDWWIALRVSPDPLDATGLAAALATNPEVQRERRALGSYLEGA